MAIGARQKYTTDDFMSRAKERVNARTVRGGQELERALTRTRVAKRSSRPMQLISPRDRDLRSDYAERIIRLE